MTEHIEEPSRDGWSLKDGYPRWSIVQAVQVMEQLDRPMHRLGYNCTMYGSVSKLGHGRDLDICLFSWRPAELPERAVDEIARVLYAAILRPLERHSNASSVLFRMMDGRVIDLCFYGK